MGDLGSDLEDLTSDISGKDDVLALDVDLQYASPQFNRLSPLDANNLMSSPWSRGSYEAERNNFFRTSASPNLGGTPFLRVRSGGSVGSPDLLLRSFLKSETGDSPGVFQQNNKKTTNTQQPNLPNNIPQNNGTHAQGLESIVLPRQGSRDSPFHLTRQVSNGRIGDASENGTGRGESNKYNSQGADKLMLPRQGSGTNGEYSPGLPRRASSGRVPSVPNAETQPEREPRKPITMHPPLPRAKTASATLSVPLHDSPLAMKRVNKKKPISTPPLSRRAPIPPSPTLPRRNNPPESALMRHPASAPAFYHPDDHGNVPARLQAALCSLQSAALARPPTPKSIPAWPPFLHDLPQYDLSTHELQNLDLRERTPLGSPVLITQSPFIDRSRAHEPRFQPTAVAIPESPGEKKLDRLRRRREIHSAVERRRRDITNSVLNQLAVLVTIKNMPECKMSKSEILQNSVKHILEAHQVLGEFAEEIRKLQPNNPVLNRYGSFLDGLVNDQEVVKCATKAR